MTIGNHGALLRDVHRLFGVGTVAGLSEDQLLKRFVLDRDEIAFEAMVARHGPMVLGVCRRVLRDPTDADDAFQATFAILARRADSIRAGSPVGHWLYGVARKVALRLRTETDRRRLRERADHETVAAASAANRNWQDLRWALDDEIGRLPDKYRAPILLCYLEGFSHEEAADQLAWPVGTVRGRLARAREVLRSRLIRRGIAPSAVILSGAVSEAAVPLHLAELTTRVALGLGRGELATAGVASTRVFALTNGVINAMLLTKMKSAALLAVAGFAATGVAVYAYQDSAAPSNARGKSAVVATDGVSVRPASPAGPLDRPNPSGAAEPGSTLASGVASALPPQDGRAPGAANDLSSPAGVLPGLRAPATASRPEPRAGEPGEGPTSASALDSPPTRGDRLAAPTGQPGTPAHSESAPVIPGADASPAPRTPGATNELPARAIDGPPQAGTVAGSPPGEPVRRFVPDVRIPPSDSAAIPPQRGSPPSGPSRVHDVNALLLRTRNEVDTAVKDLAAEEKSLTQRLNKVHADLERLRALQQTLKTTGERYPVEGAFEPATSTVPFGPPLQDAPHPGTPDQPLIQGEVPVQELPAGHAPRGVAPTTSLDTPPEEPVIAANQPQPAVGPSEAPVVGAPDAVRQPSPLDEDPSTKHASLRLPARSPAPDPVDPSSELPLPPEQSQDDDRLADLERRLDALLRGIESMKTDISKLKQQSGTRGRRSTGPN